MKPIIVGGRTDVGVVRSENQDAFGIFPSGDDTTPKGRLFVIADGMGGHAGGREASRLAVETIGNTYFASNGAVQESLRKSFVAANAAIYEYSFHHPQLHGMGTTCIALAFHKGGIVVAHIGDSRLYRISPNGILQLTRDHSKVAELVRRGLLTRDEARIHPERSMLYRAMGISRELEYDFIDDISPQPGDYFLMCTDGLTSYVEDDEIRTIVLSNSPEESCATLVELAKKRGGHDNITVLIVHEQDTATG